MTGPLLTGDGGFTQILATIRDACADALSDSRSISRVVIMPGAIAWDFCETYCGLLALSLNRMFYTDDFPIEIAATSLSPGRAHGTILAADMVLQAVRCAPNPEAGDLAPTVSELESSSQLILDDAWTIFCTTSNTLADLEERGQILHHMIRQLTTVGPEGACVGSELSFVVGISL
jgi:hypothetical protein